MASKSEKEILEKFTPGQIAKVVTIPTIAWPTVLLLCSCVVGHLAMDYMLVTGKISKYVVFFFNSICTFAVFTPMHDAVHGSVARSGYGFVNTIVGYIASLLFPLPYDAFKYLHLQHHKWTNVQGKDPDLFVGTGPEALLPFRLLLLEGHYYYMYFARITERPARESTRAILFLLCSIGLMYYLTQVGYGYFVLWAWAGPGFAAKAMLALFFDYLPHKPFVEKRQDALKATCVMSLLSSDPSSTWYLTWPLLHQNYHNIHHFAPYIPFYQYSDVWHSYKSVLLAAGTEVHHLMPTGAAKSD